MFSHQGEHSIARMAKVLRVSESGYYRWQKRQKQGPSVKELEDSWLKEELIKIFLASRCSFGRRKLTVLLKKKLKIKLIINVLSA